MAGRKPKPIEQKRRAGNPGKRPLPDGSALALVPPIDSATYWLDPADALAKVLDEGVVWIAETDAPMVALLREALELVERARAAGSIQLIIAAQKHAVTVLSELGFSPTARSRLGLAEVKKMSTLEELKTKQAKTKAARAAKNPAK